MMSKKDKSYIGNTPSNTPWTEKVAEWGVSYFTQQDGAEQLNLTFNSRKSFSNWDIIACR